MAANRSYQHLLERRATLLGAAIKQRTDAFATGLTPPGSRPPFTQTMSKDKAMDTILTNWQNPAMQGWISTMDPQSKLELHNALSQHILEKGMMPSTAQPDGMSTGGRMEMNKASSMGMNSYGAPQMQEMRNVQ